MKFLWSIMIIICFFYGCKEASLKQSENRETLDALILQAYYEEDVAVKSVLAGNILDSLKQKDLDESSRVHYLTLAGIYFSLKDTENYVAISKYLLDNPGESIDNREAAFANLYLGAYFYETADYINSFSHLSQAERYFYILDDQDYLGFTLNMKASILSLKKDYSGAEAMAVKALKIGKEKQNYKLLYNSYITLGNSSAGLNNYVKAIEYYQKAMDVAEKLNSDPNYLAFQGEPLNYISRIYQKQGQYDESVKFAKEGLKLKGVRSREPAIYCYLTNNLYYSKLKKGERGMSAYFIETLHIGDSLKSTPIQISSKTYLGEYYLREKDSATAIYYFKEALSQAMLNQLLDDELKILRLLAESDSQAKSAYTDRYIVLSDSLHDVERANRNKFARIEFETDEITNERNSLTVEKKSLVMQNWLITGIFFFLLIIFLLWIKNKSHKTKTRELQLKQQQQKATEEIYRLMLDHHQKIEEGKSAEKQRISLELHDGIMGKLSAVRLNLYAALHKAHLLENTTLSLQIDEIQSIEEEIRNIAHDLNYNLFSGNANFTQIVNELFAQIKNHSEIEFNLYISDAVNWDTIQTLVKINLYRILQEALQNIEKYANAKTVTVIMDQSEPNEISVSIADDGQGFDVLEKKSGIGIGNMKKRMEELNGKFDIISKKAKGTKITLIIPV